MPLFRKSSGYEAKKPVMANPNDGLSVRDVLAKASGKSSGADLTIDDIQGIVSKANLSERDAKRVMKGASRFMNSGYEYRLKEEGTYDVFQDGKPMSGTSRSAGNKRGKDFLGEIGVGKNVSMLMGLASSVKPAATTPATATQFKVNPELKMPEVNASTLMKGFGTNRTAGTPAAGGTTTTRKGNGAGGGGKKGTTTVTPQATQGKTEELNFGQTPVVLPTPDVMVDNAIEANTKKPLPTSDEKKNFEKKILQYAKTYMGAAGAQRGTRVARVRDYNKMIEDYKLKFGDYPSGSYYDLPLFTRMGNNKEAAAGNTTYKYRPIKDYDEDWYEFPKKEKGGVIKGGTGIKTPWKPFNAWEVNEDINLDLPASRMTFNKSRGNASAKEIMSKAPMSINQNRRKVELSPEIKAAMKTYDKKVAEDAKASGPGAVTYDKKGNYDVSSLGRENPFADKNKVLDVVGTVGKYALPFIGEALGRNAWKNLKPIKWNDANYLTGTVRDLPMPNFKLRSRNPIGPDVQTEIAAAKFGDAQQRDAEANYWLQNALSKLEQENQVMARTNEGIARNKQGQMQTDMVNAQMGTQKAAAVASSYVEPFVAAQQHLNQDMSSAAYLDYAKKAGLAEQILKYGEDNPYYNDAMKWMSARKGGKLKKKNC